MSIDVDMGTGYDVGEDRDDEDEDCDSLSHQRIASLQRLSFEMIEQPGQVWEITALTIASGTVAKPVETFEEARAAALAKEGADMKPAERAKPVRLRISQLVVLRRVFLQLLPRLTRQLSAQRGPRHLPSCRCRSLSRKHSN